VSVSLDSATVEVPPPFWYGVPHGYIRVNLYPSEEGLAEVVRQIRQLPDAERERAEKVLRLYGAVVAMMQKEDVLGCAVGVHPDDDGVDSLSVLTFSRAPMSGNDPLRVLTRMMADPGTGLEEFQPVELTAGVGFVAECERRVSAARSEADGDTSGHTVWQGMVAIPHKATSSVVVVQLVTPSVHLAEEYRSILVGVAHTVSFTDPNAPAPEAGGGGDLSGEAAAVRDVFG